MFAQWKIVWDSQCKTNEELWVLEMTRQEILGVGLTNTCLPKAAEHLNSETPPLVN